MRLLVYFLLLVQLSIAITKIEFLSENIPIKIGPFEIQTKAATAILSFKNLIAGIEQPIELIVDSGSFVFPKEARIVLKSSKHLKIRNAEALEAEGGAQPSIEHYVSDVSIKLVDVKPFEQRVIRLMAICDLPGQRDEKPVEQKISLQCPWSRGEIQVPLSFMPALVSSCRLHSSGSKKFLQVMVKGIGVQLKLVNVTMSSDCKGVTLISHMI